MGSPGSMMRIMKDFSRQARVVEFTIDREVFRGKPHLAAQTMIDFTLKVEGADDENTSPEQGFQMMMESLQMVLMPESFKKFRERMKDPVTADSAGPGADYVPIELPQLTEILEWVMGEYGMRPTQSPSPSSDGPSDPESGTSLTGSTSDGESISVNSPSTGS